MGTHETLSMTPGKKFVHHLRQVGRLPILLVGIQYYLVGIQYYLVGIQYYLVGIQ
jgi:hypothetical protein